MSVRLISLVSTSVKMIECRVWYFLMLFQMGACETLVLAWVGDSQSMLYLASASVSQCLRWCFPAVFEEAWMQKRVLGFGVLGFRAARVQKRVLSLGSKKGFRV